MASSPADRQLDELCRLAASAAARRGHEIPEWIPDHAGGDEARSATCRRCGRALHTRAGVGMTGIAGAALTEPCD